MTDSNSDSAAEKRPYLGDPQIIGKLLQNIARETIQCRIAAGQNILSPEDAKSIEEKEATNAARALLGRDRKYAVDANWNVPGVIDNFVKEELTLQAKGSEPILVEGLLKFVQEVQERLELLHNPKQDPKAEARVQDIIEKYRNVLLGLHISTSAAPAATNLTTPTVAASSPAPAPAKAPEPAPVRKMETPVVPVPSQPKAAPVAAAKTVTTDFEEPKRSGGGLKWAALLLLLLVIGGTTFFVLRKPAKAPEPVAVVEKPAPVAPKPVATAPVLNGNGTLDLIDESGKTVQTISMENGKKIGHLYDFARVDNANSFLVATESPKATFDLWLMNESGTAREVNPTVLDAKLSPDGSKIAYITGEKVLIVEDAKGDRIATATGASDLGWAPENDAVIFLRVRDEDAKKHPDAMELCKLTLSDKAVQTVTTGLYDNVMPIIQPEGKFILLIAGRATGLPSFWKVAKDGGQPVQLTNVRLDETDAAWIPTPFSTAQWSENGKWLIYDFKDGAVEQIWGMEFDDAGNVKRSTRISEGLVPRWIGSDKFVCLKSVNGTLEASVQTVPGQ